MIIIFALILVVAVGLTWILCSGKARQHKQTAENKSFEAEMLKDKMTSLEADCQSLEQRNRELSESNVSLKEKIHHAENSANRLNTEVSMLRQKFEIVDNENKSMRAELSEAVTKNQLYTSQYEQLHLKLVKAESQIQDMAEEIKAHLTQEGNLKSQLSELRNQLSEQQKQATEKLTLLEDAKQTLSLQFENLANKIFDEKGKRFADQNKVNLEQILNPLHKELGDFKQKVDDVYVKEAKERATLQQEIKQLSELNQRMNQEAQNLTKALKGEKKTQGNWGEVILEKVLESSGLRNGSEYITQKQFKNMDGKSYNPDVIIKLPDDKDVIVDAKVSLVDYNNYINAENDADRETALKKHIQAVKSHIDLLSEKNYENLEGVNSLDFILMFMPIESAFVLAFQNDEELFQKAFKQRIIVVTPTTLLATLGTINHSWKYERQNKNAEEIAKRAQLMLDKFRLFVEDIDKLGKQLATVNDSYDKALNKLSKGNGNLVKQASMLVDLGVGMKKELPKTITDQAED